MANGTSYTPMSQVKNSAQANKLGLPIGSSIPIFVPPGINPQALVNQWTHFLPNLFAFKAFWSNPANNYKTTNPIYDAFGNFMYGATGTADSIGAPLLQGAADYTHPGGQSSINTSDIQSGINAIANGGTLSTQ